MNIIKVKEQEGGFWINDEYFVPNDSSNTDYKEIQEWIIKGGIPEKEDLLAKAKLAKISQIKVIKDQKNVEPITDYKAFVLDEEGNKTSKKSYFLFYTNRHPTNPASDPDSIISRVLDLGTIPYFTEDIEGNEIVVELTPDIVRSLRQRITEINNQNYKTSRSIEATIKNAERVEDIEVMESLPSNFKQKSTNNKK